MDQVLYPQHAAGVCFATAFQSLYDWAVIHKGKIPGKWICMNKIGLLIRKSMVNISGGRFSGEGGKEVQQHSEKKAGLKWRIVQFLGVPWLHAFSMDLHVLYVRLSTCHGSAYTGWNIWAAPFILQFASQNCRAVLSDSQRKCCLEAALPVPTLLLSARCEVHGNLISWALSQRT